MDILTQYGIPFVKLEPHVIAPSSPRFARNVDLFAKICTRQAADPFVPVKPLPATGGENVLDGLTLLAVGARTSPFKTCRYDELVAAKNGISIETQDLALVMHRMRALPADGVLAAKMAELGAYTCWTKANAEDPGALEKQARFAVVMDRYLEEYEPAAVAIRCWTEWQEIMNMSVCATLSYLNHGRNDGRVVPAACEVDLGNALMMHVLHRYGGALVACHDWNNNFGEDDNGLMFMHCGPHDTRWLQPQAAVMDGRFPGHYVETHGILDKSFGNGHKNWGCIQGRFQRGRSRSAAPRSGPTASISTCSKAECTAERHSAGILRVGRHAGDTAFAAGLAADQARRIQAPLRHGQRARGRPLHRRPAAARRLPGDRPAGVVAVRFTHPTAAGVVAVRFTHPTAAGVAVVRFTHPTVGPWDWAGSSAAD